MLTMKINIQLINNVDLSSYRLIAPVDAQPSFLGGLLGEIELNIVFDNHTREGVWHA
jgi:hypothetical protein